MPCRRVVAVRRDIKWPTGTWVSEGDHLSCACPLDLYSRHMAQHWMARHPGRSSIGNLKGIFVAPQWPPASAVSRGPLAALAAPPARGGGLRKRCAAGRGVAARSVDMQIRMGDGRASGGYGGRGLRDHRFADAEGGVMPNVDTLSQSKRVGKSHVVCLPKPRRQALYRACRRHVADVFRALADPRECRVEEGHLLPDHVPMLLSIPPK
jgi:hypothetical protein